MMVTLDTARLHTIEQVEAFMQGTLEIGFSPPPSAIAGLVVRSTSSPTKGVTDVSVNYSAASLCM
jgi:hypothetical protein